jgi:hypothetical protein
MEEKNEKKIICYFFGMVKYLSVCVDYSGGGGGKGE